MVGARQRPLSSLPQSRLVASAVSGLDPSRLGFLGLVTMAGGTGLGLRRQLLLLRIRRPIYGCDGLLPDEIIANVQAELQKLGYYPYEVDGIFGPLTQEAPARFQSDHGIPVTGAIDPQTLAALGLL
jgi:hypothetical protein